MDLCIIVRQYYSSVFCMCRLYVLRFQIFISSYLVQLLVRNRRSWISLNMMCSWSMVTTQLYICLIMSNHHIYLVTSSHHLRESLLSTKVAISLCKTPDWFKCTLVYTLYIRSVILWLQTLLFIRQKKSSWSANSWRVAETSFLLFLSRDMLSSAILTHRHILRQWSTQRNSYISSHQFVM